MAFRRESKWYFCPERWSRPKGQISGKEVGPVKDINVPTTRHSACQQATSFLNFAVQVSIAGWGSHSQLYTWMYCANVNICYHNARIARDHR